MSFWCLGSYEVIHDMIQAGELISVMREGCL